MNAQTPFDFGEWWPLILIAAFDVGDLIGKSLPSFVMLLRTQARLAMALAVHTLFVPLFIFAVRFEILPLVFVNQFYQFGITLGLGISTGYTGCSAAMMAPTLVPKSLQERAGFLSTLNLVGGLFAGSLVAIPIGAAVV